MTPKVQECRRMDKSQKCNTTTESQEWLVITRERNQEAWVETDEADAMALIEENIS